MRTHHSPSPDHAQRRARALSHVACALMLVSFTILALTSARLLSARQQLERATDACRCCGPLTLD